jgi:hypothetical protein
MGKEKQKKAKVMNRVAGGISHPAPAPPRMRVRTGRFLCKFRKASSTTYAPQDWLQAERRQYGSTDRLHRPVEPAWLLPAYKGPALHHIPAITPGAWLIWPMLIPAQSPHGLHHRALLSVNHHHHLVCSRHFVILAARYQAEAPPDNART